MRKLGLLVLTFLIGLGVQACGPTLFGSEYSSQQDCGFVQNVYGQRISWKGQVPVILKIHESVPREMVPAIYESVDVWNKTLNKRVFEITDDHFSGPVLPRKDSQNVIYWSYQWDQQGSDEQARTNVYWVGDQIKEADISMNAQDNTFYSEQYTSNTDIDLVSVMVHELGHVLGLKHNDSGASVMATYLNPLQERREVPKSDEESIRCEY